MVQMKDPLPQNEGKRTPPAALADLTQIVCLGVLKHVGKDTNGQSGRDHLARGAAPEVER
jgi:hypothetical protein